MIKRLMRASAAFLAPAVILFLSCDSSTTTAGPTGRTSGTYFLDERGGVVVYRGLNVAGNAKVPDFMPIKEASLLDPLPGWGVNVIRLLFTWEAFEPVMGSYNSEYLDYIARVVSWAGERDIKVIIDFHQDAFSRYQVHGCGEGFPEWAVPPEVKKDKPCNDSRCRVWGAEMIWDFDMHTCWNRFYRDTYGVRARFLKMMDAVSARFGSNPTVLGYDILNEPWGDEVKEIAVLYEDAAKIIRNNDPDSVMFLCPHALISAGNASELPKMSFGNYAYAPHYYDGSIIVLNMWLGTPPAGALTRQKKKSDAWNVPLFWGEFGVNATALGGAKYMDLFYAWLDANHASGTQWNYTPGWTPDGYDGFNDENLSIVDNTGALRANYRVRPYARRTAGTPVKFEFSGSDSGAVSVRMEWDHDPSKGETRMFLPREALFGAGGYAVAVTGDSLEYSYDNEELYLICESSVAGRKSITIRSEN
ncbi:MAG TPA: cellulase family glycosylhydrolase [Spirochaetota bacterium]|nr:cellulase family glycosylhydrolase [Spirochaetota bacterium]